MNARGTRVVQSTERMHRTAWLCGLAAIAIVTSASTANALGPVDLEVGAKAGVGTSPAGEGANPLGFGLGGRAGLVLFDHLYGGVNLMYYFGGSESAGQSPVASPAPTSVSVHTLMYGVEAGWGFKLLDILVIRPQVGVGNATFSSSSDGGGSSSNSNLYVEPGVTGLLYLGTLFVGADANALVFPGLADSNAAFTLHGQVGLKF